MILHGKKNLDEDIIVKTVLFKNLDLVKN